MSLWVLNDNGETQIWMIVISFSIIFLIIGLWIAFKVWEVVKKR